MAKTNDYQKITKNQLNKILYEDVAVDVISLDEDTLKLADSIDFMESVDCSVDVEQFIISISFKEVQLIFLKFAGFSTKEIIEIMKLRNNNNYWNLITKLRDSYHSFFEK